MPKHCYNFAVDARPTAYWSYDVEADNRAFLEGLDPGFFSEQVEWLTPQLDGPHKSRAAVAIRLLYGHALETFFALLGATVQAPQCPLAWILAYQNHELRSVVGKLTDDSLELSRFKRPITWKRLSYEIHRFDIKDPALEEWVKEGFATAWERFAFEFLEEAFVAEHNSLKHGLRVKHGGFSLSIGGGVNEAGDPNPVIDSKSDFGTSFYRKRTLDRHNFAGELCGRNWNPTAAAVGIEVLALSIGNLIAYLRLHAGFQSGSAQYRWPTGPPNAFDAPFERDFIMASVVRKGFALEDIEPRRPDEIVATYDSP